MEVPVVCPQAISPDSWVMVMDADGFLPQNQWTATTTQDLPRSIAGRTAKNHGKIDNGYCIWTVVKYTLKYNVLACIGLGWLCMFRHEMMLLFLWFFLLIQARKVSCKWEVPPAVKALFLRYSQIHLGYFITSESKSSFHLQSTRTLLVMLSCISEAFWASKQNGLDWHQSY